MKYGGPVSTLLLLAMFLISSCTSSAPTGPAEVTGPTASVSREAPATSTQEPPPAGPAIIKKVSAARLKRMIEEKEKFLLVDTRTEFEYKQSHIPGSINIPQHKFSALVTLLTADKAMPLIFYCRGAA